MNALLKPCPRIFTVILSALIFFRGSSQVTIGQMGDALEADMQEAMRIVNIIMTVIMFAGIIYIAAALIGKRENSKGVIVGWVVAMMIWGIASSLLT